ncbi:Crp/Fnr family transcriptional regulator [Caldifermentibacillus hisashii]|uniref:Crp/Fnr family transcriptional regulator n=1 Tax=Caldifermentibacillus hisashii TaxID=996558 RepID=UPI001C123F6B|nr:Crp/Fnr family transcriptional regulator [Caldifermentibacillus hisashii]MBU5342407.1 Crp/Fnr family transcriptional regulator [Caldifermentibacillus hisashii]
MNPTSIKVLLQHFPLFKSLAEDELDLIVHLAKKRVYLKGSHIFLQGEPLSNVYFISNGKIKIYRLDPQGNEQIVNILNRGGMFPHQGFFRNTDYPAYAQAMEDTVLFFIPIHSFEKFLIHNPEVCMKIFRILGEQIVDLQKRLEEKLLYNTYEQILLLLLRLAKNHGDKLTAANVRLNTQFTNRDLANMIGSSRETISRTLSQLKKKNMIDNDENGYMIINTEKLKEELI